MKLQKENVVMVACGVLGYAVSLGIGVYNGLMESKSGPDAELIPWYVPVAVNSATGFMIMELFMKNDANYQRNSAGTAGLSGALFNPALSLIPYNIGKGIGYGIEKLL